MNNDAREGWSSTGKRKARSKDAKPNINRAAK